MTVRRGNLSLVCLYIAATLSLCAAGRYVEDSTEFGQWLATHKKSFSSVEELAFRKRIFLGNAQKIKTHNQGSSTFKMALNHFAHLTSEEFKALYLGFKPDSAGLNRTANMSTFSHRDVQPPKAVDWVKNGAVTGVKNQLFCGSCWAYSTTGSIEGANFLYSGELVSLSEQQLVDCDTSKDMGCSGGLMDYAFDYVIKNGGIDTEKDYGYYSIDEYCNKLRESRTVVSIDSFEDVPKNSEADLAKAVSQQPVSVAICATSLQFYSSGIVDDCCTELDHGVLAVGYGEDGTGNYWLVKNSWGPTWGERGYFRLRKDIDKPEGTCNIAEVGSYPIKTTPNPHSIPEICGFWGLSKCAEGYSCQCTYNVLSVACLQWGCAPSTMAS